MRRPTAKMLALVVLALAASSCEIRTWGSNGSGELGSDPLVYAPAEVGTGWASIAANSVQSCGLKTDQSLWCWGDNYNYELGLGGRAARRAPEQHPGTWLGVAQGWSHTCAIKNPGQLWCAGSNQAGQLGQGWFDTEGENVEFLTRGGTDDDWAAVAADVYSTCGLKNDTTLWCWGTAVGDGTNIDKAQPTHIGGGPGWSDVAVGNGVSCGIKTGGLWCWQPVNGTGTPSLAPVRVGSASDWQQIAARASAACGIRGGELWCWGDNSSGQLGNGNTTSQVTPVKIGSDADWVDVARGDNHSCATKLSGALWCWGRNDAGQLGLGDATDRLTPTLVATVNGSLAAAGGRQHTCVVEVDTTLLCWGANGSGQLGLGLDNAVPGSVGGGRPPWLQVSAGGDDEGDHSCALAANRSLWCWGANATGQLGLGDAVPRSSPTQVGTATDWQQVSAGGSHTCGVRATGTLWCWGNNDLNQSGARFGNPSSPRQIGTSSGWSTVSTGSSHTCAVRSVGTLYCWGAPWLLGVGEGPVASPWLPNRVGLAADWKVVSAARSHTCAIRTDKSLSCWGDNSVGQLGTGPSTLGSASSPVPVVPGSTWAQVSTGTWFTCGVRADKSLWCWGYASNGRLGNGSTTGFEALPVRVGTSIDWTSVDVGENFGCGLRAGGRLWCWGANEFGQLANGTLIDASIPTAADTTDTFVAVSAGYSHSAGTVLPRN